MADRISFRPIGIIHSPFTNPAGMPIQPTGAEGVPGRVVIDPEKKLNEITGMNNSVAVPVPETAPKR